MDETLFLTITSYTYQKGYNVENDGITKEILCS